MKLDALVHKLQGIDHALAEVNGNFTIGFNGKEAQSLNSLYFATKAHYKLHARFFRTAHLPFRHLNLALQLQ